jgi:hypothetical protein
VKAEIIRQLRSALESHNPIASFSLAPDWVVLALYEKHCGLPQSRTGMPATRSLAEINRKYEKRVIKAPAVTAPAVNNDEREQMQRRAALASL